MNIHELGNAGFTSHADGSGGIDSEIAREDRRRGRCWKDQDAWRKFDPQMCHIFDII
jgi:hypothetical protein